VRVCGGGWCIDYDCSKVPKSREPNALYWGTGKKSVSLQHIGSKKRGAADYKNVFRSHGGRHSVKER